MKLLDFIMGSFPLLISQYANFYKEQDLTTTLAELGDDLSLPRIKTWDYIVVGAGSAGCIMASRLSERYRVLLLEEGGYPVPATYNAYLDNNDVDDSTEINTILNSVPQKHYNLGTGGVFKISRGTMLGGSGGHNDNIYNRGSPFDYDFYSRITKDPSWRYENLIKYFMKMENYVGSLINEEEREVYYGRGGPITVITASNPPYLLPYWLQAGRELGFKVSDPNGYQTPSFTPKAFSIQNGEKDDSYISYIKPLEGIRRSLTVLKYSKVEQVLIDDQKRAYGVTFLRHGIPQIAHASREVILSAGVVASPILLLKSGIGPKALLDESQIPCVHDLAGVGQHLKDHCGTYLSFNIKNIQDHPNILPILTEDNVLLELNKFQSLPRSGIFTEPFGMGQAFFASSTAQSQGESNWADIIFWIQQIRYNPNSEIDRTVEGQDFQIGVTLSRPKSTGTLGFNVTAWLKGLKELPDVALVDNRFYTEQKDVTAMIEGVKLGLRVVEETAAFKSLGAEYRQRIPDACHRFTFRSDRYWECFVQHISINRYHTTGTARMGAADDPMAVVDSRLRVRGINGLRIVDASILPQPTNANINSCVMMVAEKVAEEMMAESVGGILP